MVSLQQGKKGNFESEWKIKMPHEMQACKQALCAKTVRLRICLLSIAAVLYIHGTQLGHSSCNVLSHFPFAVFGQALLDETLLTIQILVKNFHKQHDDVGATIIVHLLKRCTPLHSFPPPHKNLRGFQNGGSGYIPTVVHR